MANNGSPPRPPSKSIFNFSIPKIQLVQTRPVAPSQYPIPNTVDRLAVFRSRGALTVHIPPNVQAFHRGQAPGVFPSNGLRQQFPQQLSPRRPLQNWSYHNQPTLTGANTTQLAVVGPHTIGRPRALGAGQPPVTIYPVMGVTEQQRRRSGIPRPTLTPQQRRAQEQQYDPTARPTISIERPLTDGMLNAFQGLSTSDRRSVPATLPSNVTMRPRNMLTLPLGRHLADPRPISIHALDVAQVPDHYRLNVPAHRPQMERSQVIPNEPPQIQKRVRFDNTGPPDATPFQPPQRGEPEKHPQSILVETPHPTTPMVTFHGTRETTTMSVSYNTMGIHQTIITSREAHYNPAADVPSGYVDPVWPDWQGEPWFRPRSTEFGRPSTSGAKSYQARSRSTEDLTDTYDPRLEFPLDYTTDHRRQVCPEADIMEQMSPEPPHVSPRTQPPPFPVPEARPSPQRKPIRQSPGTQRSTATAPDSSPQYFYDPPRVNVATDPLSPADGSSPSPRRGRELAPSVPWHQLAEDDQFPSHAQFVETVNELYPNLPQTETSHVVSPTKTRSPPTYNTPPAQPSFVAETPHSTPGILNQETLHCASSSKTARRARRRYVAASVERPRTRSVSRVETNDSATAGTTAGAMATPPPVPEPRVFWQNNAIQRKYMGFPDDISDSSEDGNDLQMSREPSAK
jgi:hypothetical protein